MTQAQEGLRRSAIDWSQPTALYRLFGAAGDLLYIGITSELDARFRQHSKTQAWWPQVCSRQVDWHEDRRAADDAETIAIAIERPAWNFREKNSPMTDTSEWLCRAGILQPLRDDRMAVGMAAVHPPPWVANVIGIPHDVLTLHAWRAYVRDGERLWLGESWEYPGPRGTITEAWSTRSAVVSAWTRPASALEAEALGLSPESNVDTWRFTQPSITHRRRSCLVEAVWPAGAREARRLGIPMRLSEEFMSYRQSDLPAPTPGKALKREDP